MQVQILSLAIRFVAVCRASRDPARLSGVLAVIETVANRFTHFVLKSATQIRSIGGMIATVTDDDAKQIIAANVIARLAELGKSRYWLAQQTGRRESTIQSVCHGISCCNAATLQTIAAALGLTTDDLLKKPRKKSARVSQKAG